MLNSLVVSYIERRKAASTTQFGMRPVTSHKNSLDLNQALTAAVDPQPAKA